MSFLLIKDTFQYMETFQYVETLQKSTTGQNGGKTVDHRMPSPICSTSLAAKAQGASVQREWKDSKPEDQGVCWEGSFLEIAGKLLHDASTVWLPKQD